MKHINRRKFIQSTGVIGASAALLGASKTSGIFYNGKSFDYIIKNGNVIDGTGNAAFIADVGIKNDIITAVGKLNIDSAEFYIDAKGLTVSPGFIDIHTHTDLGVLRNPKGESKIRQGVTTEIGGNCGSSFAPISQERVEKSNERFAELYGCTVNDGSMSSFLEMLAKRDFSVNQATLLGMGSIRRLCVGMDDRSATEDEMKRMKYEVEKAVNEGAVGVATGLEYTPGSFASTKELIEIFKVIPAKAKLYATHMRNEDNYGEEAVAEAIKIAEESGCRLQLSHLKASGKSNWHKADALLELMDNAVNGGLEVHADRYTYVAYHTGLANMFPLWARDGGSKKFVERMQSDSLLVDMRAYANKKANNLDGNWSGVVISGINNEDYEQYMGKSIQFISEELGKEPFDTAVELLVNSNGSVSMVGFGMSETSTEKILSHPRVMIASDASAHAPYPPMDNSIAHPRAYGTFPRAISKYVKERNVCSLEEMIKKMTSMPADKLHFNDRGRIQKGKKADITIFDYNTIEDKAVFTDSHQYPEGIPYVIVNGKVVIDKGDHTGAMPGDVITS